MELKLETIIKEIKTEKPETLETLETSKRGLKVKLFILDNSNPCRSQFSFGELGKLRDFCEENVVTDIKFIEKGNDTTYIVAVYREFEKCQN